MYGCKLQLVAEVKHPLATTASLPLSLLSPFVFHNPATEEDFAGWQLLSITWCIAQREDDVHARQSTENSGGTFITYWTTSDLGKIWRLCTPFQCCLSSALRFFFNAKPASGSCWLKNSSSFAPVSECQWSVREGLLKWQSISDLKRSKQLRPFEQVMLLYTFNRLCLPKEDLHKQIWLHATGTFLCVCKLALTSW